jgi:hypothetical protein
MKPEFTTVENVPCWAATYFVNADSSGMNEEDLAMCVAYEEKLAARGLRLVCPIEGTRNEFCANPAFGLACDVEDWEAERTGPEPAV